MRILPNKSQLKTVSIFLLGAVAGVSFMVAKIHIEKLQKPIVIENVVTVTEANAKAEIDDLIEKGDVASANKLLKIGQDAVDAVQAIQ